MSTPGPDDPSVPSQPPAELGGLDPKDLLNAGLETMPPVTLPPKPADSDATIAVASPRPSQPGAGQVELPLPEELTNLLPHGNYAVESFLGQGGMGAVYKGMQIRLKRPVAIKIMRRDLGKDHDFEARFEREAQAMAKLNHPNIVSVIDFGEAGPDYLYIVMELIDGADLMDVIRGGQMTQEMALSLLPQICDALQFAHDHGIVHRDIKPSNIMLTRDGRIKMADFGLAKRFDTENSFRTQTGTGMGTPDYAAPEQFSPDSPIDHRADIYALGVMIYQMITGHLPRGVWKPPSQRAKVSTQWDAVVSRAMQSDPSDRYQQASEVKTDVSSITPGKGSAGVPSGAAQPARPSSKGGEAAKPNEADTSDRAPVKSRAPLLFGIIGSALVISIGAFFAFKQPDNGRAISPKQPPASTNGATPKSNPGAPGQSALSGIPPQSAIQPLPEDGWQPLIPPSSWNNQQLEDGLLHLVKDGLAKPQNAADGAIRARIAFKEGSSVVGVTARGVDASRRYKFVLADAKLVSLTSILDANSKTADRLGEYALPRPLQPGDNIVLELRAQGERLTGLVDGKVVIEVNDSRYTKAGQWGIIATDGWFESAEVQALPAPATTIQWTDALAAWWQGNGQRGSWVREKDGVARLTVPGPAALHLGRDASQPLAFKDQAVRASFRLGGSPYIQLCLYRSLSTNGQALGYYVTLAAERSQLSLTLDSPGMASHAELAAVPLPKGFDHAATHTMEMRFANTMLTVILDGQTLYEKPHTQHHGGYPSLLARQGAIVESLEIADLGSGTTVSPSPDLPVSKSSDPKFPPGQWVKIFTKFEDLPKELRNPSKGVKLEDGWIRLGGQKLWINLPKELAGDYGVRLHFLRHAEPAVHTLIGLRLQSNVSRFYGLKVGLQTLDCSRRAEEAGMLTLFEAPMPAVPKAGEEGTLEFYAIGNRLIGRTGPTFVSSATDDLYARGPAQIMGSEDLRDIEVINLDGLPEAEALRLLGVDEEGNDVRGKASASSTNEKWQDLLRDPAKLRFDDKVERKADELRLPAAAVVRVSASPKDGAIRIRSVFAPINQALAWAREASAGHYTLAAYADGKAVRLAYWLREGGTPSTTLQDFPLPQPLQPGQEYELELRAVGSTLTARVDDHLLGSFEDSRLPTGGFAVQASSKQDSAPPVVVRSLEILDLEKPGAVPLLPVSTSSVATATKDAPFTNTLGMKFVPVPITGGFTDKQRVGDAGAGL